MAEKTVSSRRPDQIVPLWPTSVGSPPDGSAVFEPYLECYFAPGDEVRPGLLICPGGGYGGRAAHEGAPVAERFNELGFHAFVVHYRVAPYRFPAPQRDALRAIKLVRSRAGDWRLDGDRIAIGGFSAGGHLAASTGVVFDQVDASAGDAADSCNPRPDALVLAYPVISLQEPFGHVGSGLNLLGDELPAKRAELSLELQVSAMTPPAFLWHTAEDPGVPVENSIDFAAAMHRLRLPVELHVWPRGPHGVGLAPELPAVAVWPELAARFLLDQM